MKVDTLRYFIVLLFTTCEVFSQFNNSCEVQGDESCCPNFTSLVTMSLQEIYDSGPLFVVFVPVTSLNLVLDNICYTASQLPDDTDRLLLSISRVFSGGRNEINSYIIDQTERGSTRNGAPGCSFLDTAFASVSIEGADDCNILLVYRCVYCGDCKSEFDVDPPVFGISRTPRPISAECIELARNKILRFGLPDQEYITYPMIEPTKCVIRRQPCFRTLFLNLLRGFFG